MRTMGGARIIPINVFAIIGLLAGLLAPARVAAGQTGGHAGVLEQGLAQNTGGPGGVPQLEPALPGETTQNVTIHISADTELWQEEPDTPQGDFLSIYIGRSNNLRSRVLINIPIWDIPAGATIHLAYLKLYVVGSFDYENTSRTLTAYRVTAPWHEDLATWNRMPAIAEVIGTATAYHAIETWVTFDITQVVRDWHSGKYPNYGIMLVGPESEDIYRVFASAESNYGISLDVAYTPEPAKLAASTIQPFIVDAQHPERSAQQTLSLSNAGSSPLEWAASTGGASWLKLSQSSGVVGAGSTRSLTLSIDPTGLTNNTYETTLQITSPTPNAQGVPKNIPVKLIYLLETTAVFLPLVLNQGTAPPPRAVALLIGISDYKYLTVSPTALAPDSWGYDLEYADNDPQLISLGLSQLGFFGTGSLPNPNNQLVLTENSAGIADIRSAFSWLDAHEDTDTIVFIGYSGHGGQVPDDNGDETTDGFDEFIAAYDSNVVNDAYVDIIRDDELDLLLDQLESQHVVVMLDSCFSGGMAATTPLKQGSPDGWDLRGLPRLGSSPLGAAPDGIEADIAQAGRVVLTGGDAAQNTLESGYLDNGVFTYYFMRALVDINADFDHNGWVSAEEALAYSAPLVDQFADPDHQNPQIFDYVAGNVDLTHP